MSACRLHPRLRTYGSDAAKRRFGPWLCKNSARYNRTRNFGLYGHAESKKNAKICLPFGTTTKSDFVFTRPRPKADIDWYSSHFRAGVFTRYDALPWGKAMTRRSRKLADRTNRGGARWQRQSAV